MVNMDPPHFGDLIDDESRTDNRVIGYVLKRPDASDGWIFLGTRPTEIAKAIECELDGEQGASMDEMGTIILQPRLFTPQELAEMPEFPGW